MAKVPPGEPTVFSDDPDDDTIEMVLSPEDMHRLSRAAEEQERAAAARETEPAHHAPPAAPTTQVGLAPPPSSEPPPDIMSTLDGQASIATTPRRRPPKNIKSAALGALAGATGALVIVAVIASWSTAHRTIQADATPPQEPTTEVATAPVPAPAPAVTASAAAPAATAPAPLPPATAAPDTQPVRYKNPFDKREIFEFPPGTTLDEARRSVADTLRQRARDRRVQPIGPQQRSRIARND